MNRLLRGRPFCRVGLGWGDGRFMVREVVELGTPVKMLRRGIFIYRLGKKIICAGLRWRDI